MRVLVTGAEGLLGSVVKRLTGEHSVVGVGRRLLDVTDRRAVDEMVRMVQPELIINCAAMARVDACEANEEQARRVNADAAGYLADAAQAVGAEMMHISTDYVFDGRSSRPYTHEDATCPISAYGRSKLLGELNVASACRKHYIVRVARLFALGGSNFGSRIFDLISKAAIENVPLEVFAYPVSQATYVPDLVDRLAEIAKWHDYGTYHIVGDGLAVGWDKFAEIAAGLMGLKLSVKVVEYEQKGLIARRPLYTALRCLKSEKLGLPPMRRWEEALQAMYAEWKKVC